MAVLRDILREVSRSNIPSQYSENIQSSPAIVFRDKVFEVLCTWQCCHCWHRLVGD